MRNTLLCKKYVVWGSITFGLVLTLFAMTSLPSFAQSRSRSRSHTALSRQDMPSGSAVLEWNPQSKVLTATVYVSGLQAGSDHAVHIHAGSCSAREEILYPFKSVVVNMAGSGATTTTFENVTTGIPASGWNITVHKGSTVQTGTLLCGNVVNPTGATSVTVPLH